MMNRRTKTWTSLLLSVFLLLGTIFAALPAVGAAPTLPTTQSATSLYMSNWSNAMNIWMASKLSQNDTGSYGPRIGEMRISSDYATNQINDYSSFFRNETGGVKYNQPHNFNSEAYYDDNGILRTKYLDYAGANMPVTVTKDFAMVPNQNFTIATFTFTNPTGSAIDYNLLEQIHVNNKTKGSTNSLNTGSYDSARNALIVDMTGSGQYFVALSALQAADSYQVADDTQSSLSAPDVAGWFTFDNNGTLKNNASKTAVDISVAFQDRFTIPANGSVSLSFAATVRDSLANVRSTIDTARSQTASYWFTQTQNTYNSWLTGPGKKTVSFADDGINKTYRRGLITIKNSIQPTSGAMPAATNPIAYGYKVWARDSAVTAMALDQAGFYDEAEKYWYWLQDRQSADGTFKTCFDIWTNNYVSFVEPEHDSIGIFLAGAYQHYQLTGNATFLNNIWTKYRKSADYLWSNLGSNPYGFGVADASIWEESIEYNTFTQAGYSAGLDAAQYMAKAKGLNSLADDYNGASSKIRSSIQRNDTWNPVGLWNSADGYYNRAVNMDGTRRTLVDGSSSILMVLGVVDSKSSRANSHINKIKTNLQHDNYGIARYDGDTFYYTAPFSPAGDEAKSDEPTWPQMSMYAALHHINRGELSSALPYLQWVVSRTAVGYMAQGEAVSRITLKPMPSTMVEPVTAAWFIMTALAYEGKADLKIIPPQANAGAYKTINVTGSVPSDLPQWSNVPYYLDQTSDSGSGSADTDITKVYVSNDANNLYVRIKNSSNALSGYNTAPRFGMMVYATDFKSGTSAGTSSGMYGGALDRPMQYMVGRWSDSPNFSRFQVANGSWSFTNLISNVTVPQWDTASGNIEMVIPLSSLSSTGTVATGDWSNLNIVLVRQNPSTSVWTDDDVIPLHYRVMGAGEAWYYGNVE
jgi:GH15 family glucan-1,4-alpha-glucosidase